MNLKDFGFLSYDCKIEGLIAYMMFVTIILWNFVLTYDVYVTVNKPLVFNENNVFYYKTGVYFTAVLISVMVYYPLMNIFADSTVYICYMQNGIAYNVTVNLPISFGLCHLLGKVQHTLLWYHRVCPSM